MNRILMLPITVPLRVLAFELRVARGAAEIAFGVAQELADAAPWNQRGTPESAPESPAGETAAARAASVAPPAANGHDPADAPRRARRAAAVQKTRATPKSGASPARPRTTKSRTTGRKPPAATTATDIPAAPAEQPKPRPRRAARKATAARPARKRSDRPAAADVAAARQAERAEEPVASVGPETGAGPEIRIAAPWEGYDAMALDEVLGRLADADETLLAAVRLYESQGEARQAILLATET
jgi:hypothetical protein